MAALTELPDSRVLAVSPLYRTAPWGGREQADFINAAATVDTGLPASGLLEALLGIERRFGRVRAVDGSDRWGPRVIDLDLLLYGAQVIDLPGLQVPHPHLHERAFALVPLLDVLPDARIPGVGSARDALAAIDAADVTPVN